VCRENLRKKLQCFPKRHHKIWVLTKNSS
jgi:hypothetical protein